MLFDQYQPIIQKIQSKKNCRYINLNEENRFLKSCPSDQTGTGTCFAHSSANLINSEYCEEGSDFVAPSQLAFLYQRETLKLGLKDKLTSLNGGHADLTLIFSQKNQLCSLDNHVFRDRIDFIKKIAHRYKVDKKSNSKKSSRIKKILTLFKEIQKEVTGDQKKITIDINDKVLAEFRIDLQNELGSEYDFSSAELSELLNENINYEQYFKKYCHFFEQIPFKVQSFSKEKISSNFIDQISHLISKKKKAIGISICASALSKEPKDSYLTNFTSSETAKKIRTSHGLSPNFLVCKDKTNHAVTLVGQRWNSKKSRCELLIRNSFGDRCDKYYEDYDCKYGSVWLPRTVIERALYRYVYLEDK